MSRIDLFESEINETLVLRADIPKEELTLAVGKWETGSNRTRADGFRSKESVRITLPPLAGPGCGCDSLPRAGPPRELG